MVVTISVADSRDAEDILVLQKAAYESEARLYQDWSSAAVIRQPSSATWPNLEVHTLLRLKMR